jgi:hypothetical protein
MLADALWGICVLVSIASDAPAPYARTVTRHCTGIIVVQAPSNQKRETPMTDSPGDLAQILGINLAPYQDRADDMLAPAGR